MERLVDKLLLAACCAGLALAAQAVPASSSAPSAGVACGLAAVATAFCLELAGARARAWAAAVLGLAGLALAEGALPVAAAFCPLAVYDLAGSLGRREACTVVLPLMLAWAALGALGSGSGADAALVALLAVAALLSLRTGTLVALRSERHLERDRLSGRMRALVEKNAGLEGALEDAERNAAQGAGGLRAPESFSTLTQRELEVARLVAEGLDNKQIAEAAYMGEGTVRNHISSILAKTGLANRTQIALAFWR